MGVGGESEEVQDRMKDRYDRIVDRMLAVVDEVLLLLQEELGKLAVQWQWPYSIIDQVSPVTYAVGMLVHRYRRWIMHVNMLKRLRSPLASVYSASVVDDPEDGDIVINTLGNGGIPMFGEELILVGGTCWFLLGHLFCLTRPDQCNGTLYQHRRCCAI